MAYEFNVHVERVYHVEVASDKDEREAAEDAAKAAWEGRLLLDDGSLLRVEVWDALTGELEAEKDQWS